MINQPNISIKDYDYPLPENKIAQFPLAQRDASKLLIWKDGSLLQDIFSQIGKYLPEECILVFNDTKVIRARLLFPKSQGQSLKFLS